MHAKPVNFTILLEQVNRIRLALAVGEGKLEQLPKGRKGDPHMCVLARALSNGWKAGWKADVSNDEICLCNYHLSSEGLDRSVEALCNVGFKAKIDKRHPCKIVFPPTKTMVNFIFRFDQGDFEDLILKED